MAVFGRGAAALERLTYADSRPPGRCTPGRCSARSACSVSPWSGPPGGAAGVDGRGHRGGDVRRARRNVVGRTGHQMADLLAAGDIAAPGGCCRRCADATRPRSIGGLARAALESVAENTSDAQVAPLLWARGRRSARGAGVPRRQHAGRDDRQPVAALVRFGWAAARFDDVANYVAARATALLVVACAPLVGGSPPARCVRGGATPPVTPAPMRAWWSGLRRRARRAARRADPVPPRTETGRPRRRATARGLRPRARGAAVAGRAGRGVVAVVPQRRRP